MMPAALFSSRPIVCEIEPALYDLLHAIATRAGGAPSFHVISAYRSPETNARLRARTAV